jgi:hypothetical protein
MTKLYRYRMLSLSLTNNIQTIKDTTEELQKEVKQNTTETGNPDKKIEAEDAKKNAAQLNVFMEKKKILYLFQTQKLFTYLHNSEREYINPAFFRSILPEPFSTSYAQQDSSEFGSRYLDQIEHCLKTTEDKVNKNNS